MGFLADRLNLNDLSLNLCKVWFRGFPGGLNGKESACNAGDLSLIPGSGRSLEKEMATHSHTLA